VVDTQPPRLIGVPSNLELDCKGQVPPMANVTAQDDCACPATVTALESHYPGECPSAFTIVREWTATDCWYVCKIDHIRTGIADKCDAGIVNVFTVVTKRKLARSSARATLPRQC